MQPNLCMQDKYSYFSHVQVSFFDASNAEVKYYSSH